MEKTNITKVTDLSGSLSEYQKNTNLSFKKIREEAWEKNISMRHNTKTEEKKL